MSDVHLTSDLRLTLLGIVILLTGCEYRPDATTVHDLDALVRKCEEAHLKPAIRIDALNDKIHVECEPRELSQ